MQQIVQPPRVVLTNWEAFMYQIKQACNLEELKPCRATRTLFHTEAQQNEMQGLSNQWGICLVGTGPNDPTEWWMIDSGGWGSARGNLAFRVGRNQQSMGAARPLPQRSSGQDYISTGSGVDPVLCYWVWGPHSPVRWWLDTWDMACNLGVLSLSATVLQLVYPTIWRFFSTGRPHRSQGIKAFQH